MDSQYLVHLVLITDGPINHSDIEELASYLEVQLHNGINVRAEVTFYEQI